MATTIDTLRGRETLGFWGAGVLAVVYLILIMIGPRNSFLLGVMSLLPFLITAGIVAGAVCGAAGLMLLHEDHYRAK